MLPRDPAGLLARIPELEPLCRHASVRRAVERGDPFALHRALMIGRWLGRFRGEEREVAAHLVGERRLFLKPLRGAPWLFTLNGMGATVYGEDERGPDGAYVKTHWLVFFFVPIFPLGAYLVADGEVGRSWRFFGRVPFGPLTWAWNRLVVLGVIGAALAGVLSTVQSSLYSRVYVLNGLEIPVRVRIGDAEAELAPRSSAPTTLSVGRGVQSVETRTLDGRVIEQGSVDASSSDDAIVWNVLGAAPVYVEQVVYTASPTFGAPPEGPEPEVHCGEQTFSVYRVDDAFVDPPASVSLSSSTSRVTRTHLSVDASGLDGCVAWLSAHARGDAAVAILEGVGASTGWDGLRVAQLERALVGREDREPMLRAVRAWREASPEVLDAHRAYQQEMLRRGEREALRAEYAARASERPGDLDAEYLILRITPEDDAFARARELHHAHPEHAPILRIVAHHQLRTGAYADAAASYAALSTLEPERRAVDSIPLLARALAGAGRIEEARSAVESASRAATPAEQRALAVLYARLGGPDPLMLARSLPPIDGEPAMPPPWDRVWARLPIDPGAASTLSPDARTFVRVMEESTRDPFLALEAVRRAPPELLGELDQDLWALLYAEACRRDGEESEAARLLARGAAAGPLAGAIARYVRDGTASAELEELGADARAAVDLVRSRAPGLDEHERATLLERARAADTLGDGARRAAERWPAPTSAAASTSI